MILITGGSGQLGSQIIEFLLEKNHQIRVMSRTPEKLSALNVRGVEVVYGDLRIRSTLEKACYGATTIISATHGFLGERSNSPQQIDAIGNQHLIDCAKVSGVKHFIYTSVSEASPDSLIDAFRIKYQTEQYLKASSLDYTILRPTAFMESWAELIGKSVLTRGLAIIPGSNNIPVNYVSILDVAHFMVWCVEDTRAQNQTYIVSGPENFTSSQLVEIFEKEKGRSVYKIYLSAGFIRAMGYLARPIIPTVSRRLVACFTSTKGQPADIINTECFSLCPIHRTTMEEFVHKYYLEKVQT